MSLTKINKKRAETKAKNITAIKKIMQEYNTRDTKKIQSLLESEFNIKLTERSIRRYHVNPTPKAKSPTLKPKKKSPKGKFPYFVYCPKCGAKGKIIANPIQSVHCYRCGLQYNRDTKKWIPTKVKRRNTKLSFDY